jgi:hypothetical protein
LALLLCLRLLAWMDSDPMILQIYDSVFCLALLSGLWASSQSRRRTGPAWLDL